MGKIFLTYITLFLFMFSQCGGYNDFFVYAVEDTAPVSISNAGKNEQKVKLAENTRMQTSNFKLGKDSKLEIITDSKKGKGLRANIAKNTEFRAKNSSVFSPSDISMQTTLNSFQGGYGFDFGISGTHLIFSKPIKMEMDVSAPEGSLYEILVKHEGNKKYNTQGLSVTDAGSCDANGNHSIPGNYTRVKNGKVTFYTCGASSYIMNPTGGNTGTNDIRWNIGDYGQAQVYYNGLAQNYGGNPPSSGGGTPSVWPILRIGNVNVGNTQTAWTNYNTTSNQVGNTYTTTNTLQYQTGGLNYTLILNWSYTAPNKFITWSYNLTIPNGNTQNVKLYYGMDSYVAGNDTTDVGFYTTSPSQTVGVYDTSANILSAQQYISGKPWDGYIASSYSTVQSETTGGSNYSNTITSTAGDFGYGINWDFGTSSGEYTSTNQWKILPYVSTSVADLLPGIAQPNPNLHVDVVSYIPLGITNAGNIDSSGVHTMVFTLPTGVNGPSSSFTSNGWSCGAQVGTTVTCTKTTNISSGSYDNFSIPVTPTLSSQGQTVTFSVALTNASDSNTNNNTASVGMQVAVGAAQNDSTPPSIGNHFPSDNMILPIGNFEISFDYSDEEGEINTASSTLVLQKWNGVSWGSDISNTYSPSSSITSTQSSFQIGNLPYGKYKASLSISDVAGMTQTQEIIFYVDELEFTINSGSLDIGSFSPDNTYISDNELIVTIKTVGVPFQVSMNQDTNMNLQVTEIIPSWNGSDGFGYKAEPYTGNINAIGTNTTIASQGNTLNTNGNKNTYTYKIKFGGKISAEQIPGDYMSSLSFLIQTSYGNPPGNCIFDQSYFGCSL